MNSAVNNLSRLPPLPARRPALDGKFLAAIGGVGAAVLILFLFDPAQHPIYPVCPLHETTGLLCPGCGALRAIHQLSHGHLAAAWRLNPFFVAMIPVLAWLGLRQLLWQLAGRQLPGLVTHKVFLWLFVAATVLFGILRNVHV